MFVFIIAIVMLVIVYYLITAVHNYFRIFKLVENIPNLPALPFLGHALYLYKIKSPNDLIDLVSPNLLTSTYKISKLWVGPKIIVAILNPKHIEVVLSSKDALDKDSIYNILRVYGGGVFNANGRQWKELRKPLNKLLSMKMIESYFHLYQDSAVNFCKVLERYSVSGEELDLRILIGNYCIDALSASTLGYETNEVLNEKYRIGKCADEILNLSVKMMIKPHLMLFQSLVRFGNDGRDLIKLSKDMWHIVGDILNGRRKQIMLSEEWDNEEPKFYSDVLIKKAIESGLSHDQLARLASDYVIAGFDAPAVLGAATLMLLAMFPEHEEAVYREQVEILGEDLSVLPSWNDLSKMHYLNRVIKETSRIFCPIAILRTLKNDIALDDQFSLPKGSTVYISIYDLHRDPSNWSHPHEFYPDHFLPEEVARRPKGTFLPFSWGPRGCPGSQFGITVIKVLVARIIREYKLQSDKKFENLRFKYSLLMEPEDGFMMRVIRRNSQQT